MEQSITPRQSRVSDTGICTGTLGKVELETVAACIVLYHWEHSPDEWIPITRRQIADWIPTSSAIAKVCTNPFWKLDISGFIDQGFIEGWGRSGGVGADDYGTLTPKFLEALARQPGPAPVEQVAPPPAKLDLSIPEWENDGGSFHQ